MRRNNPSEIVLFSCRIAALLAIVFAGLGIALVFAQGVSSQQVDSWFSKPYELPKDVFDLPEFDRFRTGGRLDVEKAEDSLEALSDSNLPAAQRLFDIFAWRAFVALNWPALNDGQPDAGKGFSNIDPNMPRVWEFWQQTSSVFLPDGGKPSWTGSPQHSLDQFKAGWRQNTTVNEGLQAFSGPLVDQNGRWVHYVSLMNRREFDHIVSPDPGHANEGLFPASSGKTLAKLTISGAAI